MRDPMRYILTLLLILSAGSVLAGKNLPDYHDQNEVPAELEKRQNEDENLTDPVDINNTPDVMEERQQEEEWRDNYEDIQYDNRGGNTPDKRVLKK